MKGGMMDEKLKAKIDKAYRTQEKLYDSIISRDPFNVNDNETTRLNFAKVTGRWCALKAVFDAINGNTKLLDEMIKNPLLIPRNEKGKLTFYP
jgi:hypothetical protein